MPFNWPLLGLVVATCGVVLTLAFFGMYLLNKSIDQTNQ